VLNYLRSHFNLSTLPSLKKRKKTNQYNFLHGLSRAYPNLSREHIIVLVEESFLHYINDELLRFLSDMDSQDSIILVHLICKCVVKGSNPAHTAAKLEAWLDRNGRAEAKEIYNSPMRSAAEERL